ncbi:DUF192 domain-containing protein [Ciceribacter sp. RN22]|uniref:DUF192 domain-containing protein n=1 Tax=Ciceribacter sp. RN22 TaxID=2954932 RepID=UPI002092DF17|nr:DUF192 domain-containing protein [Ciceribacter sp. RN22]MCO6178140.1 DUF192 domain-containing protein [Ciceribacter sp. RN22]
MIREIWRSAVLALFLLLPVAASAEEAGLRKVALAIETPGGDRHVFQVEWAGTPAERERGLMFRTELDADAGMIFDFGEVRTVMMWMKNTPLPLDMLFIDEKGVVSRIAERTVPYSQDIIASAGPVRYVLEINGGRSATLGIVPGSRVDVDAARASLK